MSTAKTLLIGGLGLGVAALFLGSRSAHAAVPPGWSPPPGATRLDFPKSAEGGIGLTIADWASEAGQPPGRYSLIWDPADPASFVALFWPAATPTTPGVLSTGSTANSQLILSTVPGLIAAMQAKGLH